MFGYLSLFLIPTTRDGSFYRLSLYLTVCFQGMSWFHQVIPWDLFCLNKSTASLELILLFSFSDILLRPVLTCDTHLEGNIFFNGPRRSMNFNDGFGGANKLTQNLLFNFMKGKREVYTNFTRRQAHESGKVVIMHQSIPSTNIPRADPRGIF